MVNHHAITPDMPGGTRHFDLARQLVQKGHDVTIIASSFHYSLLREMRDFGSASRLEEELDGVKFVWMKTPEYNSNGFERIKNMRRFVKGFRTWAKEQTELPDVIIGSTVHPFAALAAGKFARKKSIPFIFEIRDLWPQTMIDMGQWSAKHPAAILFKRIERKTVKMAKAVIALSPLTAEYLQIQYGFKNTHLIPNGIDLEQFEARGAELENLLPSYQKLDDLKKNDGFVAMFTGAIVNSNNVGLMLDAAKLLREKGQDKIQLALVGRGQEIEAMKVSAAEAGLNNFHFVEPVPKDQVPHLLKRADALLLVQGKVLWGSMNKLFDYLASRKPVVVAVDADHNAPLRKMPGCISLDSNTPENLATALIELSTQNEAERNSFGDAGYAIVQSDHNIAELANELESVLKSVQK